MVRSLTRAGAAAVSMFIAMAGSMPAHAATGVVFNINMAVDKTSAVPGDVITYTVTVSNVGDTSAFEYTVLSHIPSQTTEAPTNHCPPNAVCIDPSAPTPGVGNQANQINYSNGPLDPGQTAIVIFAVSVNSNATIGSVLPNQAQVEQTGLPTTAVTSNSVATTIVSPTTLTNSGATSGSYGHSATLAAKLADGNGAGVPGRSVTFTVGSRSCAGISDSSGIAACAIVINQMPGSYTLTGSFAGDGAYRASNYSTSFSITPGTSLTLNFPASVKANTSLQLKATLLYDGAPISGAVVTLTLGPVSCHASTNASGVLQCGVNTPSAPGTYTTGGTYAGNGTYPATTAAPGSILVTS